MRRVLSLLFPALVALLLFCPPAARADLTREALAELVVPPYGLGEQVSEDGVWELLDSGGGPAGYVFETKHLAAIPGFSGEPVNLLITLDREGDFIDVIILEQNEPVFVSGLGPGPFHEFVRQYRGLSVGSAITVGVPYGAVEKDTATNVYLDGVTKATASVRVANQTVLAAALKVARERLQGISPRPTARPDPDHDEALDWDAVVAQGLARRLILTNAEVQAAFADSIWEDDDPEALDDPEGLYLDLWLVDLGPPSLARALLDSDTLKEREALLTVAPHDEPILLLANGRHRLVSEDYVRNTSPDRVSATQSDLPVSLRDADIDVGLADGVPDFEQVMMLRIDRRLGFDPGSPWSLAVRAVRAHGQFMPEMGTQDFALAYELPVRFFLRPVEQTPPPPWLVSLRDRALDLAALAFLLGLLFWALARRLPQLSAHPAYAGIRLATLAVTLGFIGWWAQGQLSIVTPLGAARAGLEGRSFEFLLYDPVSLLIWIVTLISLFFWGRGFFCGWLCPYGALQEFAHHTGRLLRLPQIRVRENLDRRLKWVKYAVLLALCSAVFTSSQVSDAAVEVEPFKTAITMVFLRDWPYVVYAVGWLLLGLFVFKAFCRYVCPLGALLALLGWVRRLDWIARRAECGAPCQLCTVRCKYGSIDRQGRIDYAECFQCLDCVTIKEDPKDMRPSGTGGKDGRAGGCRVTQTATRRRFLSIPGRRRRAGAAPCRPCAESCRALAG